MRRALAFAAITALSALIACDPVGNGNLASMSTDRLCQYYQSERAAARGRPAEVRAELEGRGAVDPKDWPAIDAGEIHYGMNKCEIQAMGGAPLSESRGHSVAGEIDTILYPAASITLTAGKVTAYTSAPH